MNPDNKSYDYEIDLHEVARTIWRGRLLIIIVTLTAALVAMVSSAWIFPKKYLATAYISISAPIMTIQSNISTTNSLPDIKTTLPDIKSMADLAMAPGLVNSILTDPAVIKVQGKVPLSVGGLNRGLNASVVGLNLIRLQVTDTSPKRAAMVANTWARKVVSLINNTYSTSAIVKTLDDQVTKTKGAYDQAQAALEDELSKNQAVILQTKLDDMNQVYKCLLSKSDTTTSVLNDLQVLKHRLTALPAGSALSLGDALALTTLQQRALSSRVCNSDTQSLQVQVSSDTLLTFTSTSALNSITQIQDSLNTTQEVIASEQAKLDQDLPQLSKDLANASAKLTQLTTTRDQAKALGDILQQEQKQVGALSTGNQISTISIQAVPPVGASSPKLVMNTGVAGALGLILAVFWVFLQDWWQKGNGSKQEEGQDTGKKS